MRAVTIECKEKLNGRRVYVQYRQDAGMNWSIWTRAWSGGEVRISKEYSIDEVLKALRDINRDNCYVKYELI